MNSTTPDAADLNDPEIQQISTELSQLIDHLQGVVVGQTDTLRGILTCMLAGGHGLLEGVPGLGKTLMIRTLASAMTLEFSRIQFTPDLMPADVVGTSVLAQDGEGARALRFEPGPIFGNLVLADEINRATPKTQSALLEAMAERQVTTAGATRPLPAPFFVLATQNPLEQEGTYPLPEAQLDRFFFKLKLDFPSEDDLVTILERTTGGDLPATTPILNEARLLEISRSCQRIPVPPSLTRYVARIVRATHPNDPTAPALVQRFVRYGASPRGAQAVLQAAKISAVFDGRPFPSVQDAQAVVHRALGHRLGRNFEGEAEGVSPERILDEVVTTVAPD